MGLNIIAQTNSNYYLIKDIFDNVSYNIYVQEKEAILVSKNLDIINLESLKLKYRINLETSRFDSISPIFYISGKEMPIVVFVGRTSKQIGIYSFHYWHKDNILITIDSVIFKGNYPYYTTTNVCPKGTNYIFEFSKIINNAQPDTAHFIEFSNQGQIKIINSYKADTGMIRNGLLGNFPSDKIIILNSNRFAISSYLGSANIVTIVDSNFIKFSESAVRRKLINFENETLGFPKISRHTDTSFYVSGDEYLRSITCPDHFVARVKLRDKNLVIEDSKMISIPEQYCKENTFISNVYYNKYFTISYPQGLGYMNMKNVINNEFYVTYLDDLKEIWHKSYGGDYTILPTSIQSIDSCHLLVTGGIYDYFKNGNVQVFYAIIDCQGNIVNSNIDLKEVEPSMVYPNPVNGVINLNTDLDVNRLELYNLQGSLLNTNRGQFLRSMDVSLLPAGTYLLKIFYNGKYKMERVVIMTD